MLRFMGRPFTTGSSSHPRSHSGLSPEPPRRPRRGQRRRLPPGTGIVIFPSSQESPQQRTRTYRPSPAYISTPSNRRQACRWSAPGDPGGTCRGSPLHGGQTGWHLYHRPHPSPVAAGGGHPVEGGLQLRYRVCPPCSHGGGVQSRPSAHRCLGGSFTALHTGPEADEWLSRVAREPVRLLWLGEASDRFGRRPAPG